MGQSRLYHLDVKYLEKMEQETGAIEPATANGTGKAAKEGRTNKKRSYRPQEDDDDTLSPF